MKQYADDHGLGLPVGGTYFYVRGAESDAETVTRDVPRALVPASRASRRSTNILGNLES